MGSQRRDFAEFYRESCDDCLGTVVVSVGDRDTAQFATSFTQVSPTQAHGTARPDLVYASPQCTGS